jgi:hypothetical protein
VIEELCSLYDDRIKAAGTAEKMGGSELLPSMVRKLRHLRWMLATMPRLEAEKANRWLGFVQGVLFDLDFYTIDELRAQVTEAKG